MKYLSGLLCFLLLFSGVVLAQEGDEIDQQKQNRDRVLSKLATMENDGDKFEKEKNWDKAIETYINIIKELRDEKTPDLFENREEYEEKMRGALFKLGYSLLEGAILSTGEDREKKLRRSKERLRQVLLRNAEQGEAYYYMAKLNSIYYNDLKTQDPKKAAKFAKTVKTQLKQAAKFGYNVFVGINSDPQLAFLKSDATLITEVLQSARKYKNTDINRLRDPFRPRIVLARGSKSSGNITGTESITTQIEAPGENEQKRLVDEIDTTFKTLQNLVARAGSEINPSPKVIELWQRLQRLLKQRDEIIAPHLVKRLNEILKDYAESRSRLEKVQLAYYFNRGKKLVREMERSFALQQFESVVQLWGRLREVAQDMVKAGGDNFRKSAQVLLENGRKFYTKATTYIDLKKIKHKVTGIIREDYPRTVKIAIVNNRPYTVGEFILNDKGRPVKLKIVDIKKGKVVFKYKGVEVVAYLRD